MEISERLKFLLSKVDKSQRKIANDLGISAARLNNYIQGTRLVPHDVLSKLSNITGCNPGWLLTGDGEIFISPLAHAQEQFITLPLAADIAAGDPLEALPDSQLGSVTLPRTLLHLPPPYYAFRVSGDSMTPEIHPADVVIVSASYHELDLQNRVCAFRTPDGILLKRLYLDHKHRTGWLYSVNARSHPPLSYDKDTPDLHLIGVLILLLRNYLL